MQIVAVISGKRMKIDLDLGARKENQCFLLELTCSLKLCDC